MKRYGQIYDKICTMENLYAAHMNARKDKLFYREVDCFSSFIFATKS